MTSKSRLPEEIAFPALTPQPKPAQQVSAKDASRPKASRTSAAPGAGQDEREKVLMGVRLHPDDIARLKHYALDQRSTVSGIISEWIARYIK